MNAERQTRLPTRSEHERDEPSVDPDDVGELLDADTTGEWDAVRDAVSVAIAAQESHPR